MFFLRQISEADVDGEAERRAEEERQRLEEEEAVPDPSFAWWYELPGVRTGGGKVSEPVVVVGGGWCWW